MTLATRKRGARNGRQELGAAVTPHDRDPDLALPNTSPNRKKTTMRAARIDAPGFSDLGFVDTPQGRAAHEALARKTTPAPTVDGEAERMAAYRAARDAEFERDRVKAKTDHEAVEDGTRGGVSDYGSQGFADRMANKWRQPMTVGVTKEDATKEDANESPTEAFARRMLEKGRSPLKTPGV